MPARAPVPAAPAPVRVEGADGVQRLPTLDRIYEAKKEDLMNNIVFKKAAHNPPHLFVPNAIYMVTASIYDRKPLIGSSKRKRDWVAAFQKAAEIHLWQIIAWVVLHDHYHAIVQSPDNADSLSKFVSSYHKYTARQWNHEDNAGGRKVWWNYWDTCIRDERDYLTRLRYVFWNPVKHSLTGVPEEYEFSNYLEFLSKWHTGFELSEVTEVSDVPG